MAETPLILANNLAIRSSITAQSGADARFSTARMADLKRYTRWQSTDTLLKNIDFSVPVAYRRAVNCLVIDKNHTLSGVACRWLHSDNGSAWTQVDSFTPSGSGVILRSFVGQSAHAFYRLEVGASAELHRIYQIWFGEAWSLEFGPVGDFDPKRRRFMYDDTDTEGGVIVRVNRDKKRLLEMTLLLRTSGMKANFYEMIDDLENYGGFAWCVPQPTTEPTDILYMIHKMQDVSAPSIHRDIAGAKVNVEFEEVLGS